MAEQSLTQEQQRRLAALACMDRFADAHSCTSRTWREIDQGDVVAFVGKADDGREFCLGYQRGIDAALEDGR